MAATLEEKREKMIGFLLENIIAKSIERKNDDVVFIDDEGIKYWIKTLSRQSDFQYDFSEDQKSFDNDRQKLKVIRDQVASFLELKGSYIPGFVFLQADTDYSQLEERTEPIVNRGHFLKQKLPSKNNKKHHFDKRLLDPLEVVLQQFYKNSEAKRNKTKTREYIAYHPELYYFNPKSQRLDIVWFADTQDPAKFKQDDCPICKKPNVQDYDHAECRNDQGYWKYARARDEARYEKQIWIVKKRKSIDSRSNIQAEHGIKFEPTTINGSYLGLCQKQLNLAVIS